MTSTAFDQSLSEVVDDLMEALRGQATPGRAAKEKSYLKSDLDFLGAPVPAIRRAARGLHRQHRDPSHDDPFVLVDELWDRGIHELRMAAVADLMLEEREFFIRKAIGWVLREAGKRDPAAVVGWLESRLDRASGLTVREAVRYLPDPDRARLRS